jgi:hypothetical protein
MNYNNYQHNQEYTQHMSLLVENSNLSIDVIKVILSYSGSKNYKSIYQQCLKDYMKNIKGTKVIYTVEYIYGNNHIYETDNDEYILIKVQMKSEYLKRYVINPEMEDLNDVEKMFYLVLINDVKQTDPINTYDIFITRYVDL